MKKLAAALVTLACLLAVHPARAEIGTADAVPAATLLLPYFEVDLGNPNGITTLLSVNNASATAVIANVTIWTDWGVPSLGFQIYLTGYDVQAINIRDIFNGVLPVTADAGSDPSDQVSHKGPLSQDINFPGGIGPCGSSQTLYNQPDPTLAIKIQNIQRVHRGLSSPIDGKCWGAPFGDSIVRGYVTVDTVDSCSLSGPADDGYFTSLATSQNVLWGDYSFVNPSQNVAYGDNLVHIEACNGSLYVGNGAGNCPFVTGDYTFYGRYVGGMATDQREPLATTFAARYAGIATTDLLVWRDTKTAPTGADGKQTCGSSPGWFPLSQSEVVGFDNVETDADLCSLPNDVSPASGGVQTCFPLATQRVNVKSGNVFAKKMHVPFTAGWLYLNLNHALATGDPFPGVAQAWVSAVRSGEGRFSTGQSALQLDNALTASSGGHKLIP